MAFFFFFQIFRWAFELEIRPGHSFIRLHQEGTLRTCPNTDHPTPCQLIAGGLHVEMQKEFLTRSKESA